jgi:hypothetical protein
MNTNISRGLIALALCAGSYSAAAQGTAFSYQGHLSDGGNPANGFYDMTFQLWNDSGAGSQVGGTLTDTAIGVTNGLFTVTLDFGAVFDGTPLWLQIGVRTNGVGAFSTLSPRQQLTPEPYAIYSEKAGLANTLANGAVSTSQLNTLGAPANGQVLGFNGSSLSWLNPASAAFAWNLTGNAGTTPGVNFLGTTDNRPLDLRADNLRGLELAFAGRTLGGINYYFGSDSSMNVIGGYFGNAVLDSAIGATIGGGGYTFYSITLGESDYPNTVTNDFGTIGGGAGNTTGGYYATVPGGYNNRAFGDYSFVAGASAVSTQPGSFVFADSQGGDFVSTLPNEMALRLDSGIYMATQRGIRLDAQDRPMITRGWDAFNGGAPNGKAYCGRWGLFMEPGSLTVGIPNTDVPGGYRQMEVARYNPDGSRDTLLSVGNNGITTVKVLTITGGADVAEPFEIAETLIPKGAVVVIDEEQPGRLKIATTPYDTHVAGIISGANGINPGLALHQSGALDEGQNVALSGRVYVLADASTSPIRPGDLLTTSSIPGRAMRASDHARAQGAIIGKAMTRLEHGQGMVLVLVSLE